MSTVTSPVQTLTIEQQLAQALAENAALKAKLPSNTNPLGEGISCKVSPKGAVSIYGMGRWPITLYKTQLVRLFKAVPELEKFMIENDAKLSVKPPTVVKA